MAGVLVEVTHRNRCDAWRVRVDTYADPPHDIYEAAEAPIVEGATYRVQPRSIVMLLSQSTNG